MTEAKTLGELKSSGYQVLTVRQEMRKNLISKLQAKEDVFPNIVGYQDTVIPQLENAILSGQDVILLGERGQAKSRIIRSLTSLLDEWTPVLADVEIPENPYAPISAQGKKMLLEHSVFVFTARGHGHCFRVLKMGFKKSRFKFSTRVIFYFCLTYSRV